MNLLDRLVLSFFSSRRNWDFPNPSPAGECAPPPPSLNRGEGNTRWREQGESRGGRVPIPSDKVEYCSESRKQKNHPNFLWPFCRPTCFFSIFSSLFLFVARVNKRTCNSLFYYLISGFQWETRHEGTLNNHFVVGMAILIKSLLQQVVSTNTT